MLAGSEGAGASVGALSSSAPDGALLGRDSRLRGNDGYWGWYAYRPLAAPPASAEFRRGAEF